ncbi:hypothetical protein SALCHL_002923 [Streptomyces albus subsp. chlorinus]|nr:hypothetical protein [Streptomyces albus]
MADGLGFLDTDLGPALAVTAWPLPALGALTGLGALVLTLCELIAR